MDRQVAKESDTYPLDYEIAGEKFDTQIRVNYGQYYTVGDSNLKSMITMEDPKSGDYEQYIYVNPLQKTANGTVVRVQGFQTDPTKSNGQVNQNATQIKILKVANDQPLNSSFGVNDGDYEDVTNQFQVNYSDKNYADINFGNLNGQRYIIKVTSKEVPDSKEDLNLRAIMATKNIYGQYNYITWDNDIVRSTSSGTADGNEASYQLGDKVWNDVNKNGIQDQGETGIADVKVTLKDRDGNILDTTYTNTNGKYIFDNLKNGIYQVDFETPAGFAASPSNQGNDSVDSDGPTNAQAVISDGNNLTVDQGFYQTETPTHNVGDKVWEDLNKDGIQDQNEPGIANVKVTLKDADGNVVDTRTTDDKGNYLFEKVKEGEYTIEFETPEGYTPTQTGQGRVSTDSNGTSSLILVEGNDDLTIDSGFYKEPVTHKVGDKVWDDLNKDGIQDDNEPGISNVKVTLKDADGNVVDTRTTDANGNYLFENVKEGDYTIEFETPEGYTPTVTGQGTADNDSNGTSTKVTVKDGDDLTIDSGFTQVTPEPPTEPENPSPEQPSEPGQPENPSPEQPSEPGQPENPSPEQPSEPGQPENPSPEQPSEPGQPENPSPEQPSEPGQPKNPSPEQPNNPSVPGVQNPEKPSLTPVTQPVHSNGNKAKPSQQQKALPETGETESHQGTLFGGILAALGALLFARKKRHDKKQSH
ncbi:LPXTG cell wall anchor domain-containing protein [Staphylococcus pseudintermedius]|nr:LPXTG cell wall anchor domain-containing protein [Staphylococcus pseudintermedius]